VTPCLVSFLPLSPSYAILIDSKKHIFLLFDIFLFFLFLIFAEAFCFSLCHYFFIPFVFFLLNLNICVCCVDACVFSIFGFFCLFFSSSPIAQHFRWNSIFFLMFYSSCCFFHLSCFGFGGFFIQFPLLLCCLLLSSLPPRAHGCLLFFSIPPFFLVVV